MEKEVRKPLKCGFVDKLRIEKDKLRIEFQTKQETEFNEWAEAVRELHKQESKNDAQHQLEAAK